MHKDSTLTTLKPAERLGLERQEMPARQALDRAYSFAEVNLGFTAELAAQEAQRCLMCKKAKCVDGCPVKIDIPTFIGHLAQGDLPGAANVLFRDNALPSISGRVCPQESQCEAQCIRGKKGCSVAIGHLERFVADWAREHNYIPPRVLSQPSGRRVAVVGSGPAGLTAAGELARMGHAVTVFEALHEAGGVLIYGIPEFRLPKEIVRREVKKLKTLGVEVKTNVIVGQSCTLEQLLQEDGYAAVFVANGAGLPVFLGIPGENFKGVYSANEYLTRVNLMAAYQSEAATPVLRPEEVVVVGGGNTAMDAVRTARRLGAHKATLVYRRSLEEMPARAEEIQHAREEGVSFQLLTNPTAILSDEHGWVRALRCSKMMLGEPDQSGRRKPVPVPGSDFELPCQVVIEAIGTRANPLLTKTAPDLKLSEKGYICTDENGMTSIRGVFAGGDIVRGAATVILAMGDGKRVARSIDAYLQSLARERGIAADIEVTSTESAGPQQSHKPEADDLTLTQ